MESFSRVGASETVHRIYKVRYYARPGQPANVSRIAGLTVLRQSSTLRLLFACLDVNVDRQDYQWYHERLCPACNALPRCLHRHTGGTSGLNRITRPPSEGRFRL